MMTVTVETAPSTKVTCSSKLNISTVQISCKATIRNRNEVRSRLLNKRGIFKQPDYVHCAPYPAIAWKINIVRGMGHSGVTTAPTSSLNGSPFSNMEDGGLPSKLITSPVRSEPFKYKDDDKIERRKISFDDSVSVVLIPMRCEYSDGMRARLWSDVRNSRKRNNEHNRIQSRREGLEASFYRYILFFTQVLLRKIKSSCLFYNPKTYS